MLVPSMAKEVTGHIDTMVRFLSPTLAAVAYDNANAEDRDIISLCTEILKRQVPDLSILHFPMIETQSGYASPVNWVQLGNQVLVPHFPEASNPQMDSIAQKLQDAGFIPHLIPSPTSATGGSLHCLTASIFV